MSIDTSIRRRVAIAQLRIRPQHVITAEDIQVEQRDLTGRDALNIPDVVINRMASRWLRAGQVFEFDIHIQNLTRTELGALLWLLQMPPGHTVAESKVLSTFIEPAW